MQETEEEGAESEDDDDDSIADEFEEVDEVQPMFSSVFRMLELTPAQQKDLFKAAAKGLFNGEQLYHLNVSQKMQCRETVTRRDGGASLSTQFSGLV